MARASVSKTEGWEFESLYTCHYQIKKRPMTYRTMILEWILAGTIPKKGVVSPHVVEFERGRKMRRDGKKSPPKPADDDTSPVASRWIGYRVELASEHDKACEVAEKLGMPRPDVKE